MNRDPFQQAWKSESAQVQVTFDLETLSKEVQQCHESFQSTIYWRDVREAASSLVLIPVCLVIGYAMSMPWTWYLSVPACLWIVAFVLVDRRLHPQRPSGPGQPLGFYAKESLTQVEHQIWLLRNVFWWYLLPFCISIMAFFIQTAWQTTDEAWAFILFVGGLGLFLFVIYWAVYRLNQTAVRDVLEPRREKLLNLIAGIDGEINDEDAGNVMDLVTALSDPPSNGGLNLSWADNWNQIIPSWREAGVITVSTLAGACCGLYSALRFQIPEMGPAFFQAVVSAVLPFEATLFWYIWRAWKKNKSAWVDEVATQTVSPEVDSAKGILPRAPAILVVVLTLLVGVLAILAVIVFSSNVGRSSSSRRVSAPIFNDVSAMGDPEIASIDAWLQAQTEQANYPSLTVAIVREGEVVYGRSFGFEDISDGKIATLKTKYHVASVTKAFTASLAVLMQEEGLVDLDKPVVKYLPANVKLSTTPDVGATITLRQLASHASGLPRGVPGRVQSVEGWYALEPQRLYDHLARVQLVSEPGSEELYSNLAFGLLGHALERAAGKPFDQLIDEFICEPLKLEGTAIQVDNTLKVATGYSDSERRYERTHSFQSRLAGSGGLVTTAEDLALFLSAQMSPGVFSLEALEQLQRRTWLTGRKVTGTALGWSLGFSGYIGNIVMKGGGRSNCSAWIGFSPEHNVGVVALTNCGGPDVDWLGRWLLERSVPGAYRPVTKMGFAKVAPYTGVRWEQNRPIVQVKGQWYPLVSIDEISIDRIIEFAEEEFGEKAQQRFSEDLVEVLSKMGHEPDWTVTLGVTSSDGQLEQLPVLMTEANRDLVRP